MKFFLGSFPVLSSAGNELPSKGIDWTLSLSTLITGVVVVFAVLIVLVVVIQIFGNVIHGIGNRKAAKKQPLKAVPIPPPAPPKAETVPLAKTAIPLDSGDIPREIVAVISAAVVSVTGGKGRVHTIRESRGKIRGSRPAWSSAGLLDNTRPF